MDQTPCAVLIFSSISTKGAVVTFEALHLGAFDYIAKPDGTVSANLKHLKKELVDKIIAGAYSSRKQMTTSSLARRNIALANQASSNQIVKKPSSTYNKVVVIGVSTGGPGTLSEILPHFQQDFPAPILLIQHMPPKFTASFAERLDRTLPMKVVEAKHRMILETGTIYVAPGGLHMHIERQLGTGQLRITISDKPAGLLFKPNIDITMQTLVANFPAQNIIGVLLTGLGDDGARGMLAIKQGGGYTIAESEETSIVYGMPKAAIEMGGAHLVLPAYHIARQVNDAVYK
jgi:two-component system chemotaxis response regulator CheB